ncbi:MAG: ribosomal protein S18-alanine N-acetyltransferase [Acidobacteria bacterium]|nr:ribosomal protein S18-alanine N-acetyltransferase [Acidobacteriota bacterium]
MGRSSTDPEIKIVILSSADIPELRRLDLVCGLHPWSVESYSNLLSRADVIFLGLIDTRSRRGVVGFFLASDSGEELDILKIAVDPEFQGQGLGGELLGQGLQAGGQRGCRRCFLEVRISNQPAREFYSRNGFGVVALRKNYYTDPVEDALIMEKSLGFLSETPACSSRGKDVC